MMHPCRDCSAPARPGQVLCSECDYASKANQRRRARPIVELRERQRERDPFFDAKFERVEDMRDPRGYTLRVRAGWDFAKWVLDRVADIPTSPSPDVLKVAA